MKPRYLRAMLLAGAVLTVLSVVFVSDSQASGTTSVFTETFDGSPGSPTPWDPPGWDVSIHSRDRHTWYQLETMNAAYGPDCAPPPATHTISRYEDAVFQCNGRLMTAIQAEGYGVIYLTPDHMVDFSTGEAVVRFDLSTLRTSIRDWTDLWISPYAEHLAMPLDGRSTLQGYPRDAIHIRMEQTGEQNQFSFFRGTLVTNFVTTTLTTSDTPYETVLTPSATRLDTFELRLSKTHVRFGMPQYDLWWVDKDIPELSWGQGVVQFGHHSFNPTLCGPTCTANTWQWDNVSIAPAVPFSITDGVTPFANADQPVIHLASPVQAGAKLRFVAYGPGLEVSSDAGKTWQAAQVQPAEFNLWYHFQSYWMDLPPGAFTLLIRNSDPDYKDWVARDVSIWYPKLLEQLPSVTWTYLPLMERQ